jgi:hypothetical protein
LNKGAGCAFVLPSSRYWTINLLPLPTEPKYRRQRSFPVVSKFKVAICAQQWKSPTAFDSPRRLQCQVLVLLLQLGKISQIHCLSIRQKRCWIF